MNQFGMLSWILLLNVGRRHNRCGGYRKMLVVIIGGVGVNLLIHIITALVDSCKMKTVICEVFKDATRCL